MLVDKYPSLFSYQKRVFAATGSPSSICEMVILQCELRVMAKIYQFVWEYLRLLLGIKRYGRILNKNTSAYFHSASLVV